MRPYLTALAMLLGAMLLYHGLVLRDLIGGQAAHMTPAAAELLIAAAAAMGLAALTMRAHAGLAAVEMALAGVVVLVIAGPDHRYLLAYGAVAVVLAVFAAIAAAAPPSSALSRHGRERHDPPPVITTNRDAGIDPAHVRTVDAPPIQEPLRDRAAARRVLRHVHDTRGRRRAARQAWRSWRSDPPPRQEEPPKATEPTAVPGAIIAAPEQVTGESAGHSGEGA